MHFVARSTVETAYNAQGYTLRQDPLVIFKQPPSHIGRHASFSQTLGHHRTNSSVSGSSLNFNHLSKSTENDIHASDPLLPTPPEILVNHEKPEEIEPDDHDCRIAGCRRIVINVAGQKYETQVKTLNRLPTTLLGNEEKRSKYWDPKRNEYFFDRHRPTFPAILYYYQSGGRLKRPVEVPMDIFIEELQFYELGTEAIEEFKVSEGVLPMNEDDGSDSEPSGLRSAIWRTFEQPGSTVLSTVVAIVSVVLILTSICTYCIETLPALKNSDCINVTKINEDGTQKSSVVPNFTHPLFLIESCCIAWFVFELIIRAASCPSILRFIHGLSNWIDFISITPYFMFLLLFFINGSCDNNSKFFSVLRVFRVARIFKLGRFSDGLQILGKTLQVSIKELSMFVLFLAIGVVIFAAMIYFVEIQTEESFFVSIPDAFWWAVISMTTVGYGDVYPVSVFGKLIGAMCVLSGLLAIALPVPVIVTNFNNIYRQTTGRGNNL